jgi:hypothetical protein
MRYGASNFVLANVLEGDNRKIRVTDKSIDNIILANAGLFSENAAISSNDIT